MISPVQTAPKFEVLDYLETRASNDSFTMVELGHGRYPVVDLQPHSFTGQQCYIGVEAGMRGQGKEFAAKRTQELFVGKNAFFLQHYIGEGKVTQKDILSNDQTYDGEYHTETVLPAGIANEVVASNVFCDPLIALSWSRTVCLLQEVSRLLDRTGTAVLRETITPGMVDAIGDVSLSRARLQVLARVTPMMGEAWQALENVYGVDQLPGRWDGYYLFLGKTATDS